MYTYKGVVTRVVDGDTVDAVLDVGFGIKFMLRVRIDGYDAPETWRPSCDQELHHGMQATKRAEELLLNKELTFRTSKLGIYGRYGASISIPNVGDFATKMISEGLAKKEVYNDKDTKIIRT